MPRPPGAQFEKITQPLELEFGGRLEGITVAYESWGRLSPARDNVILVCPAFSANCHAQSHPLDPDKGWWEGMIGPGLALDTKRFHVICPSLLGSCHGTTGPLSIDPKSGESYAGAFPVVSIRDIADTHVLLLDALGIDKIHAVVGSSMGGMQSLELAIRHPSRARHVVSISATDQTRPATAAVRHLGRKAIMNDPAYKNGFYGDVRPEAGLRLAREIGTVFYRSKEEFNDRFKRGPIAPPSLEGITFDVQSYLNHQAEKILDSFDVNAYLRLSLAMDCHDLARDFVSLRAALSRIRARVLVGGVIEDRLMTIDEQRNLRDAMKSAGVNSEWFEISSPVGHDAFLVDKPVFTRILSKFLGGRESP